MSFIDLELEKTVFRIDSAKGFDLSIPLQFQGDRLSAFGVSPAQAQTVKNERFTGDTKRGGSCNVKEYRLIPHCQGTHTECVGHIVNAKLSVCEIFNDPWIPSLVLSVEPEKGADCPDRYFPEKNTWDDLISKNRLIMGFKQFSDERYHQALIIRTLPNDSSKKTRRYITAPYFSNDALSEIVRRPVQHLLVDLPSIDRMSDEGKLSNHRIFWNIADQSHDLCSNQPSAKTITELIFVPDEVDDGYYLLNLQIPPFMTDAAPSRPLIFPAQ